MADTTPEPPEGEDATSSSGSRRSGLDRLRAARGGSGTEATSPTSRVSEPSTSETRSPGSGAGRGAAGADQAGAATTLLETPEADEVTASGKPSVDERAGAGGDAKKTAGGRRKRGRTDAGAGTVPAESTAGRRFGRTQSQNVDHSGAAAGPADQRQKILAIALAVLVIALLIPVIAMRHRIIGQSKEEKAVSGLIDKRTEALAEARRFAVTFFSPDYKTIDQYSDQIAAQSTGQFNQDFVSKRGELKSLLTKVQSQASGRVLAAGVSKVSGNDVEVLVVADQDVKNTTSQGKTVTNRYRVRVSLQKSPKGWLVTDLAPVV